MDGVFYPIKGEEILLPEHRSDPMLDMFVFETTNLLEQLEQLIINSEEAHDFTQDVINEMLRIMHTIKGSSAMMHFDNISTLAHSVEDLFYFLRETKLLDINLPALYDVLLESVDFIKTEIRGIENGDSSNRDASSLIKNIEDFLRELKKIDSSDTQETKEQDIACRNMQGFCADQRLSPMPSQKKSFKAVVYFEEGCEMENVRAYNVLHSLRNIAVDIRCIPANIIDNDDSAEIIRKEGFQLWFKTDRSFEEMHDFFSQVIFLKDLELVELDNDKKQIVLEDLPISFKGELQTSKSLKDGNSKGDFQLASSHQNIISVNVAKLDKLMDLVGELVISEAMLTQNPDIKGLELNSFQEVARQHRKIINELQDIAMSIRMVPLSTTFQKMNRIVRDMSKKLSKTVRLEIVGEETEVDKNIIEHISDPLIHLIRNSMDHGIETVEERRTKGKPEIGTITLEAKNVGGDVLIIVKDDGRGLDRGKILAHAREKGLTNKSENELTDKEIYSYIFLPGFSTKDEVTEFSGRGVGLDVVAKNISAVGGTVSVDSVAGKGTTITLKIPLTLAIMDGMVIRVGKSTYTIPIVNIRESFKAEAGDVITDSDGNEMIMVRGKCYPILKLYELYKVKTEITHIPDGIIIMVENENKGLCIFADELIGEQQIVVKALPSYITNIRKVKGVAGCTLLGDGSISLILDVTSLIGE